MQDNGMKPPAHYILRFLTHLLNCEQIDEVSSASKPTWELILTWVLNHIFGTTFLSATADSRMRGVQETVVCDCDWFLKANMIRIPVRPFCQILHGRVLAKYTDKFPLTLFRIHSARAPKLLLREKEAQAAKNSTSYDYVAVDGKYVPLLDDLFSHANGMSLRPNTLLEWNMISGKPGKVFVIEIAAGTPIPEGTILVHEFDDHFSLQTARPTDVEKFNAEISAFLKKCKVYSRAEWLAAHPIGSQVKNPLI
jgi:hypothetical protein